MDLWIIYILTDQLYKRTPVNNNLLEMYDIPKLFSISCI